jgi:hypothetical protein
MIDVEREVFKRNGCKGVLLSAKKSDTGRR